MPKLELTEPQERHIETALKMIDKAAQRVDYWVDHAVGHAGPAGLMNSLDPAALGRVREVFRRLQATADDIYHSYEFHAERLDLRHVLEAEASGLWVILEDCRPERMGGYGPMAPEAAEKLGRDMKRLLELVQELRLPILESRAQEPR